MSQHDTNTSRTPKKPKKGVSHSTKKAAKKVVHTTKKAAAKATPKKKTSSTAHHAAPKKKRPVSKTKRTSNAPAHANVKKKSIKKYSHHKIRKHNTDTRRRRKAEYLSTLPKKPWKRILYKLHPRYMVQYWFSKQGLKMALKLSVIGFILMVVTVISVFAYFRKDLPDPTEIRAGAIQSTKFYDRTGETLLYEVYGEKNRTVKEFSEISDYVKDATLAIEDKDFYEHGGFSLRGITRAALNNVSSSEEEGVQGGSTLTQQFIKNAVEQVGNERTVTRKIKELILSMELERIYEKDEILGFYLNEISYGAQVYGVEAAARNYFDKPASELTLDEAAILAAMPQAPSYYSPYGNNLEDLRERQDIVLELMYDQKLIQRQLLEKEAGLSYRERPASEYTIEELSTKDEEARVLIDEAKEADTLANLTPIEEQSLYRNITAPHFVLEVQRRLEEEFGQQTVNNGGLKVITTLDLELQEIAEESVAAGIPSVEALGGNNAALTSTDVATGQVLAYVGSRDFFFPGYGSYDAATPELGRQPGSSFKPFAYAEMFKNDRWSPGSVIWDSPTTFTNHSNWTPQNHSGRFFGAMSIRAALAESRNIPAAKAIYIAGVDQTVDLAKRMGNNSICETTSCSGILSIVLGAGEVKLSEHTHAYSTFARGGVHKEEAYVLRVENGAGEVLKEWQDSEGTQVLDPEVAYLVNDMLADTAARARLYGSKLNTGYNLALKTGTTDSSVDGWLMGHSTCLATGVWVGNDDSSPMNSITSNQTGPIWLPFMSKAHELKGCGNDEFPRPDGIKTVSIDSGTGRNASEDSKKVRVDLAPSWFKGVGQGTAQKITIDTVSNKLATECTPERAREEITDIGIAPELAATDPYAGIWAKGAGYSNGATSINDEDDVHECDDKKPAVALGVDKITDDTYELTATVTQGTHQLDEVTFYVNGSAVATRQVKTSGSVSVNHTFANSGQQSVTVEVVDSALYHDTNARTVDVAAVTPVSPPSIFSPASGSSVPAGALTLSWAQVPDADEYRICVSENSTFWDCSQTDPELDELEVITVSSGNSYEIYIIAKEIGAEVSRSSTVTVSVP